MGGKDGGRDGGESGEQCIKGNKQQQQLAGSYNIITTPRNHSVGRFEKSLGTQETRRSHMLLVNEVIANMVNLRFQLTATRKISTRDIYEIHLCFVCFPSKIVAVFFTLTTTKKFITSLPLSNTPFSLEVN